MSTQAGVVAHCRAVADSTDLLWFCGDDILTLAHLAEGAVSVVGHVASQDYAVMIAAVEAGDLAAAPEIHRRRIPVTDALMTTSQGAIMVSAALVQLGGIESAFVRLPFVESPPEHLEILRAGLSASSIE